MHFSHWLGLILSITSATAVADVILGPASAMLVCNRVPFHARPHISPGSDQHHPNQHAPTHNRPETAIRPADQHLRLDDAGVSDLVGDARGLADFIVKLAGDPDECKRLGDNARRALEEKWSQARAFERWRSMLRDVETGAGARSSV